MKKRLKTLFNSTTNIINKKRKRCKNVKKHAKQLQKQLFKSFLWKDLGFLQSFLIT